MKTSAARFVFEDAKITRVKELPTVCFLTVYVQAGKYPDWEECVLFQPPAFPLVEGDVVTVLGDIQKKKPKAGSREWTIEFIAREVRKGDASKAPTPKQQTYESRGPSRPAPSEDPSDEVDF